MHTLRCTRPRAWKLLLAARLSRRLLSHNCVRVRMCVCPCRPASVGAAPMGGMSISRGGVGSFPNRRGVAPSAAPHAGGLSAMGGQQRRAAAAVVVVARPGVTRGGGVGVIAATGGLRSSTRTAAAAGGVLGATIGGGNGLMGGKGLMAASPLGGLLPMPGCRGAAGWQHHQQQLAGVDAAAAASSRGASLTAGAFNARGEGQPNSEFAPPVGFFAGFNSDDMDGVPKRPNRWKNMATVFGRVPGSRPPHFTLESAAPPRHFLITHAHYPLPKRASALKLSALKRG